jgi:hypothetical protein
VATDYRARKREGLERALEVLAKQWEAAISQSATAIDAVARVQAEQQADDIEERMDALHERLDRLALAPPDPARPEDRGPDPGQVLGLLRERLHRIDFREVERVIRRLLDDDLSGGPDAGRAGLLLFEGCSRMSGPLCLERIGKILKDQSGALYRHFPVELQPGDRNDTGALLRKLAAHLRADIDGRAPHNQLGMVCECLCGSLQAGSIALLDIRGCDWLVHDDPAALRWIATDFWRQLLSALRAAAQQMPGSVTVVAALSFDDKAPVGMLEPNLCCSVEDPCRERLLAIELLPWTRLEVMDWLSRWGMPDHPWEEKTLITNQIMQVSRGEPLVIENELLKHCGALQPAL